MPLYEYHCDGCDRTFERLVPRPGEGAEAECPACGAKARKILSRFAVSSGSAASPADSCPNRGSCEVPGGL